jgi:hypothetical protein
MQRFIKRSKKYKFAEIMEKPGGNCGSLLPRGQTFGDNPGQFTALDAVINDIQSMAMKLFGILKMVDSADKKNHLPGSADPKGAYGSMEIINFHPPGKMHGINHLQEPGGNDWILAKNLDNLGQGIIGFLENDFKLMHHGRKRGEPLSMAQKLPAFTNPHPRAHSQVVLQRAFQFFAQRQAKRSVRGSGSHQSNHCLSLCLFRKNNPDRVGADGGEIAQEILFLQARQGEIAHDNIRHNPGKKLLEFFNGFRIADQMRPASQQFVKRGLT